MANWRNGEAWGETGPGDGLDDWFEPTTGPAAAWDGVRVLDDDWNDADDPLDRRIDVCPIAAADDQSGPTQLIATPAPPPPADVDNDDLEFVEPPGQVQTVEVAPSGVIAGLPPEAADPPHAAVRPGPPADLAPPAERPHPHPHHPHRGPRPTTTPAALLVGAALLAIGGAVGWLVGSTLAATPRESRLDGSLSRLQSDLDALRSRTVSLAGSLAEIRRAVSDLATRPAPAPPAPVDLEPIRRSLDQLSAQVQEHDLGPLRERLDTLVASTDELKGRVDALASAQQSHQVLKPPAPEPGASPAERVAAERSGATRAAVATLPLLVQSYTGRQYRALDAALRNLLAGEPEDARVWYLAGLARGYSTGDWNGEATALVRRARELESAGHPARAEVDAFLRGFEPAGRNWINRARPSPPSSEAVASPTQG